MNYFFKKDSARGFTLIELLVVISIIGLLSSVILASVNSARTRARDASRVQSMREVRNALELYFSDNKTYPTSNMTIEALVSGPLANYLKALSPNFKVPNTTTAYLGGSGAYEILIKTESGGSFAKNIGCLAADYSGYDNNAGKTYCLGNYTGGAAMGAPAFTVLPTQGGVPGARTVYWTAVNTTGSNPCKLESGDDMLTGIIGTYPASASINLPQGSWTQEGGGIIESVSMTITCSASTFQPAVSSLTIFNEAN